jgi:hypothetical protein
LRSDDGPDDAVRERRLTRANLLKRVFAVEIMSCRRCEGPMRLIAFTDDARVATRILEHLGCPPAGRRHAADAAAVSNSCLWATAQRTVGSSPPNRARCVRTSQARSKPRCEQAN